MSERRLVLTLDEAATAAALEVAVVRYYVDLGLLAPPSHGYGEADLAELRRIRRLIDDLGFDLAAVEVVLRMRQRVLALQAEVRHLEAELRAARYRRRAPREWDDAEWYDL